MNTSECFLLKIDSPRARLFFSRPALRVRCCGMICFLFGYFSLHAQDKDSRFPPGWNVTVGAGLTGAAFRDGRIGALVYQGRGLMPAFAAAYRAGKADHRLSITGYSFSVKASTAEDRVASLRGVTLAYSALFPVAEWRDLIYLVAGPGIDLGFLRRTYPDLINASRFQDGFGAAVAIGKIIVAPKGRAGGWLFSDRVSLSVFAAFRQASYSDQSLTGRGAHSGQTFLRSLYFRSFDDFSHWSNEFDVAKSLTGHHSVGLTLRWDFTRMQVQAAVRQATAQAGLNYSYHF